MRATLLNFRSPAERTAEYRNYEVTKTGHGLNFTQRTKNTTGTTLPKSKRFKD